MLLKLSLYDLGHPFQRPLPTESKCKFAFWGSTFKTSYERY